MNLKCQSCGTNTALPFSFTMAFQPIVDFSEMKIWGYEALVRGPDGQGAGWVLDQVTPDLMYKFDQSCRVEAIELAAKLFLSPETRVSINFMPNAVYEPKTCLGATLAVARRLGFAHDRIVFELTETERILDIAHVQRIIEQYRAEGFLTALDDFGSGYAGLNLLSHFIPDIIKIDMGLIRNIHNSINRQIIVKHTIDMARELGIKVLAEGIESEDELNILRNFNVELFQGYLFGRPEIAQLSNSNFIAAYADRSIAKTGTYNASEMRASAP